KPIRTATDLVGTIYPDIPEEDFDISVDDDFWADTWEIERCPTARAYRLLDRLDLGLLRHRPGHTREQNPLTFIESFHPGDSSHVVFAEDPDTEMLDPVTASLLQARLVELGTRLRLVRGRYECE